MQSRRSFVAGTTALTTVALAGCSGLNGGDEETDDGTETGPGENNSSNGENNGTTDGNETDGNGEQGSDGSENENVETGADLDLGGEPGRYTDLVIDIEGRPLNVSGQKFSELSGIDGYNGIEAGGQWYGTSVSEIEYFLEVIAGTGSEGNLYRIGIGSFELETVLSQLQENVSEVTQTEEIGGFQTLEATNQQATNYYGVGEEALVVATDRSQYESVIDVLNEEGSLLVDSNDNFATLSEIVADANLSLISLEPTSLSNDPTGNAVAGGAGVDVGESESTYVAGIMYETEQEAIDNEAAVGDLAIQNEEALDSVKTAVDGRIVLVRGTGDTADLASAGPQ